MRVAREGCAPAGAVAVVGVVVGLLSGWAWAAPVGLFALAVLLFFRDPERSTSAGANAVISPADGRICAIAAAETGETGHRFADSATTRISVFMSPLDVHINRMPVDGTVERIEHRAGSFRAAYADEASEVNESNSLLVRTSGGARVVVVQIAGWLARRIICYIGESAALRRGERFGLIMFGSRVDVFLPPGSTVKVAVGERVSAGSSVIAELEDNPHGS